MNAGVPQARAEAHVAEFIASYVAVSVAIYLVVQLWTVGEKDK